MREDIPGQANVRARRKTARSIDCVSLPVKVFCAGVVRAQQGDAFIERAFGAVAEARARAGHGVAGGRPGAQEAVHGDGAERHDDAQAAEQAQFLEQVGPAVDDLVRQRLVGRRRAAADWRHEGAAQRQAVAAVDRQIAQSV